VLIHVGSFHHDHPLNEKLRFNIINFAMGHVPSEKPFKSGADGKGRGLGDELLAAAWPALYPV
jgi:hypothetical protein